MNLLRRVSLSGLLLLGAACAAPSWQSAPWVDPASALPANVCRVVLVREGKVIGRAREVLVSDNGREIGALGESSYLCWERAPERGVASVKWVGYKIDGGPVENVFDLPREPGATGWFVIRLREGDRKPMVEEVTPEEGRALIAGMEPAKQH